MLERTLSSSIGEICAGIALEIPKHRSILAWASCTRPWRRHFKMSLRSYQEAVSFVGFKYESQMELIKTGICTPPVDLSLPSDVGCAIREMVVTYWLTNFLWVRLFCYTWIALFFSSNQRFSMIGSLSLDGSRLNSKVPGPATPIPICGHCTSSRVLSSQICTYIHIQKYSYSCP